jgi:hypothetical protein
MRFRSILLGAGIAASLVAVGGNASAAGQSGNGQWVEAQSLRELPAGVQVLLGVGLTPDDAIADRNERFNAGDVVTEPLPSRRFALGMVNGDTAVVAVERGGRGYSIQTLEFKQVGDTWAATRCVATFSTPPHRGGELLDTLAHPAPNLHACGLPSQATASR